jgi:hypothetical protein
MAQAKAFKLAIQTGNEAFGDEPISEVVRILLALAARLESQGATGLYENIRDANGNTVGTFKLVPTDGPFSE